MGPRTRNWSTALWRRSSPYLEGGTLGTVVVDGAAVTDHDRGVVYRVTIGRGDGRVWLRTLEVVPDDPAAPGVSADMLRRIPAVALAHHAALFLDERARLRDQAEQADPDGDLEPLAQRAAGLARMTRPARRPVSRRGDSIVPTSEEVAAMLRAGETRTTLAARYGRSPSTVSDWIGRAYREVPDKMPPRRAGRRPQTPADDPSADH